MSACVAAAAKIPKSNVMAAFAAMTLGVKIVRTAL